MVLTRARELAVSSGRASYDTEETDFVQAQRELTGIPTGPATAATESPLQ